MTAEGPRFLLIKRFALSKKIERIAPKGKIQPGEKPEDAAVREIGEEAWLDVKKLIVKEKLDTLSLQLYNDYGKLWVDKDITYFLIEYTWEADEVTIQDGEWFVWMYKWAEIVNVLNLVIYKDLREVFRLGYSKTWRLSKRDQFIKNF